MEEPVTLTWELRVSRAERDSMGGNMKFSLNQENGRVVGWGETELSKPTVQHFYIVLGLNYNGMAHKSQAHM